MIVPKLTFHQEDSSLPPVTGTFPKSSTMNNKETTSAPSRTSRTKSLDSGRRTLRQNSAKSDSSIPRRQSDSAVKLSHGITSLKTGRQCEEGANSLKLLDIRSQSGAESIISSRSEGSGGSRASNGGANQRRKSESEKTYIKLILQSLAKKRMVSSLLIYCNDLKIIMSTNARIIKCPPLFSSENFAPSL